MISELQITNFKCFENTSIPFGNLTVLSGVNAAGKSTIIQALLLIRQTIDITKKYRNKLINIKDFKIPLNGNYCLQLGSSEDIVNINSSTNETVFSIEESTGEVFSFEYEAEKNKHDLSIAIKNVKGTYTKANKNISINAPEFHYLNTERIGPRLYHVMAEQDFINCGFRGEHTGYAIAKKGPDLVDERRRFNSKTAIANTLEKQIEYWMDFIIPGSQIRTAQNNKMNLVGIEVRKITSGTDFISPHNMGFGMSYVMPIIVSGLIAKCGAIYIVENPEVHLHPSGQSRIGEFLAQIASSGVQVIVETHSEHVINGMRIAALKGVIKPNRIQIDFCYTDADGKTKIEDIILNEYAEIDKWPEGFLDEEQNNLHNLIMLKRKVHN